MKKVTINTQAPMKTKKETQLMKLPKVALAEIIVMQEAIIREERSNKPHPVVDNLLHEMSVMQGGLIDLVSNLGTRVPHPVG